MKRILQILLITLILTFAWPARADAFVGTLATAIVSWIAGALGAIGVGTGLATVISYGVVWAAAAYGTYSLSKALRPDSAGTPGTSSATYDNATPVLTVAPGGSVPNATGICFLSGNIIRQNDFEATDYIMCLVDFGEGEWDQILGTYVNGIEWSNLEGAHQKWEYLGTANQAAINNCFTEDVLNFRNHVIGEYKLVKGEEIRSLQNITIVARTRKCLEIGQDIGGTTSFTRNPAQILWDFYLRKKEVLLAELSTADFAALQEYCAASLCYTDKTYYPVNVLIPSSNVVKATTTNGRSFSWNVINQNNPMVGSHVNIGWVAASGTVTNQRVNFDFGRKVVITRIQICNHHDAGANTDAGIQNFDFQGSNDPLDFAELAFDAGTWVDIDADLVANQHPATDTASLQTIDLANNIGYRYHSLNIADNWGDAVWMAFRQIRFFTGNASAECVTDETNIRYAFDFNNDTKIDINDYEKIIWESFNGQIVRSQGVYKPVWDGAQEADDWKANWTLSDIVEVDPNSRIALAQKTITATLLTRNEDAYVYRDFGTGNFYSTFHTWVDIKVTAIEADGRVYFWAATNDIDDMKGLEDAPHDFLAVYFMENAGSYYLIADTYEGGAHTATDSSVALALNTTYYLIIKRDSSGLWLICDIYSDAARTILVDTITAGFTANQSFRYLFGLNSYNAGSNEKVTCLSTNFRLDPYGYLQNKAIKHDFIVSTNVVEKTLSWQKLDHPNIYIVNCLDSANAFKKCSDAILKNDQDINIKGEVTIEETCWWLIDYFLASRRCTWKHNKGQYPDYQVALTGFPDSQATEMFDRTTVTDTEAGWTLKDVLVVDKDEDQYGRSQFLLETWMSGIYGDKGFEQQPGYAIRLPSPLLPISAEDATVTAAMSDGLLHVTFTPPTSPSYLHTKIWVSTDDINYTWADTDSDGDCYIDGNGIWWDTGDTVYVRVTHVTTETESSFPTVAADSVVATIVVLPTGGYTGALGTAQAKTLAVGVLTVDGAGWVEITSEAGVADDFDGDLLGLPTYHEVYLYAAAGHTITIKPSANKKMPGNFTLVGPRVARFSNRGGNVVWAVSLMDNRA